MIRDNDGRIGMLKIGMILYFSLTIFEAVLNNGRGSLLKFFGYLLLLAITVTKWRNESAVTVRFYRIFKPVLLWFAFAAVSLVWSQGPAQGFDYILSIGNVLVIALFVTSIEWKEREIYCLFGAYGVSTFIFALMLIVSGTQVHSATLRYTVNIFGTVYDPNVVVGFIAPGAILLLYLMLKVFFRWFVSIPMSIIILYAVFLTGSRGGVLAVGGTIAFYILAFSIKKRMSVKKIITLILMILAVIVGIIVLTTYLDSSIVNRVFHIDMSEGSSLDRMNLLQNGVQFFKEKPFLGLGIGGTDAVSNNHGTHNMYMFILCDMGIVGFGLFLFALGRIFRTAWKSERWELTAMFVCTCCVIFFLDSYHAKYFWNTLIFLMLILISDENTAMMEEYYAGN